MSREPSMEEILSSIRRVIARDEEARDAAISERFGDDSAVPLQSEADDDVLDLSGLEDAQAPADTAVGEEAETPVLVSTDSAEAARHSLGQLTAALNETDPASAHPAPNAVSGMTIEALAEAALRPMLKQWLDTNLPPMVERLVAREIARITGGRI
jgi:uncharacterized protein